MSVIVLQELTIYKKGNIERFRPDAIVRVTFLTFIIFFLVLIIVNFQTLAIIIYNYYKVNIF